jgi:hypothetical protein
MVTRHIVTSSFIRVARKRVLGSWPKNHFGEEALEGTFQTDLYSPCELELF